MRASRTIVLLTLLALALAAIGCGGGAAEPEPEPEPETTGDEAPAPEAEPEPVAEPEPEPTGPGQIRVTNVVDGEPAGGTVRVVDESGEVAAEGASGDTFVVDSGTYRVQGEITDASVLIDTPTQEGDGMVTVPAGGTAEAQVEFPVSRIRIEVTRRGRPVRTWRMTVQRQGFEAGEEITLEPSSEHVPITPGRYDARLRMGGTEIEVNGLIFQGGATQTVPVAID